MHNVRRKGVSILLKKIGGIVSYLQQKPTVVVICTSKTYGDNDKNNKEKAKELATKRTWGDREGHWGCWLWYVIVTKVIFSFRKSVFRDGRTDYNLDLRFLVKLKKQISMIMADLS